MKKLLLVILFLITVSSAFASTDARFIERDSPLYAEMDALYALSCLASPNTNRPWTESQARLYLSKVDYDSLSDAGKELYKSIEIEIEKGLTMVDCTFDGDNLNFIIECSQDKFETVRENATSVKGSTALKLNIDRTRTTFVADCKKFKVDIAYLFIEKKSDRMIRFIYDTETGKFE